MFLRPPPSRVFGITLTLFLATAALVGAGDLLAALFPEPGWAAYLLLALATYLILSLPAGIGCGLLALLLRLDPRRAARLALAGAMAGFAVALTFFRWLPERIEITTPAGGAILAALLLGAWICAGALARSALRLRPGLVWRGLGAVALLLLVAALLSARSARQRRLKALTAPATAAATVDHPSFLLIVLDTLRADRLGVYGNRAGLTPALDGLAAEGTTFLDVLSSASYTTPAHASLFTGDYPCRHGVGNGHNALSSRSVTLAERFTAAGYVTLGVVANAFLSASMGWSQGFDAYDEQHWGDARFIDWFAATPLTLLLEKVGLQPRKWLLLAALRSGAMQPVDAATTARHLQAALARVGERRFFAFANFMDPHYPYASPAAARDPAIQAANRAVLPVLRNPAHSLADQPGGRAALDDLERAYDAEVRYLDSQLGRLLDALRDAGVLRRTWVVVTADHGEHFGEHDLLFHGNSLYAPLVRIPLIVRPPDDLPDAPRGVVLRAPLVSIVDIPLTLLDLAGIEIPEAAPGSSLRAALEAAGSLADEPRAAAGDSLAGPATAAAQPRTAVAERNNTSVIAWGDYKAFFSGDSLLRVVDRRRDPSEARDLRPSAPDLGNEAHRRYREWRSRAAYDVPLAGDTQITPVLRERLRALGYVE